MRWNRVKYEEDVKTLKKRVESKTGVPSERLQLFWGDKELVGPYNDCTMDRLDMHTGFALNGYDLTAPPHYVPPVKLDTWKDHKIRHFGGKEESFDNMVLPEVTGLRIVVKDQPKRGDNADAHENGYYPGYNDDIIPVDKETTDWRAVVESKPAPPTP